MSATHHELGIVFANLAGVARAVRCDPLRLAQSIRSALDERSIELVAAGFSEVVRAHRPGDGEAGSSGQAGIEALDDLAAVAAGFGGEFARHYLTILDSSLHRSDAARTRKWQLPSAAPRVAAQIELWRTVQQGLGVLTPSGSTVRPVDLRPAGPDPGARVDDPLTFAGSRDTEPRKALVVERLPLGAQLVDVALCQLGTISGEPRVTPDDDANGAGLAIHQQAADRRIAQLRRLVAAVSADRPAILIGDFNCRIGGEEFRWLATQGFEAVRPRNVPLGEPNSNEAEREQSGWPYTHLKHGVWIDHALVRGLANCELEIIELPGEASNDAASDHRPIVLRVR